MKLTCIKNHIEWDRYCVDLRDSSFSWETKEEACVVCEKVKRQCKARGNRFYNLWNQKVIFSKKTWKEGDQT